MKIRSTWFMAAFGLLVVATPPGAMANQCRAALSAQLAEYGIDLKTMRNLDWEADRLNETGRQGGGAVSSYRLYGQPAQCADGRLAIDMTPQCRISDIRTRGGCEVDGIRSSWF